MLIATILSPSRQRPACANREPLHREIYERLRAAILDGQLVPGGRLPSTRALAVELGLSRTPVFAAYEQLLAEGYVEGRIGSGTFVAYLLPEMLVPHRPAGLTRASRRAGIVDRVEPASASKRGKAMAASPHGPEFRLVGKARTTLGMPFRVAVPALDAFPYQLWSRSVSRSARHASRTLVDYQAPIGYLPLRREIAARIGSVRGVNCDAEQVVITAGAQAAIDLALRVLLDPGDAVWLEDPGHLGARAAIIGAGAHAVPVPVDADGIDVAAGERRCAAARLAFVTPSHQFPLAVTMSLTRRLALLDWARRARAWIIEDDYDSEFRHSGRPLPALQGLDRSERVIYIGSFSKVMFPGLRLGYLVAPSGLVETMAGARRFIDTHAPALEQAALADFMGSGHLDRHIRRMRGRYAACGQALAEAASRELSGQLDVQRPVAGMHTVGLIVGRGRDRDWAARAAAFGIEARPVSLYCVGDRRSVPQGLVLGYGAVPEEQMMPAVRRLAAALLPVGPGGPASGP